MKYLILVGDGMADYPIESLGWKTPLMKAKTPFMDGLAAHGEVGLVKTVPEGFTPGSEIANLSILGYDPKRYYRGRGPLEAASLGLSLEDKDIAFRCNLVTLTEDHHETLMEDFSAGHIGDDEARQIILDLDREMGNEEIRFYPGVSYRHVMIWKNVLKHFPGLDQAVLTPPHDIIGQAVGAHLPGSGRTDGLNDPDGMGRILDLMIRSMAFLKRHPINLKRLQEGKRPGNSIWLWGQGRSPRMVPLRERFGIEGFVISAVHLLKGIGICAGLEAIDVPGATGYFDTNYEGKAQYALHGLRQKDFAFVHVEAPDEAGHMGDERIKIEAIEAFDAKIVGPVLQGMKGFPRYRMLVLPDHPTPVSIRTHVSDPVPYILYDSAAETQGKAEGRFDEEAAKESGHYVEEGYRLIERLFHP